jgi:leucyl aminopeptidase
MHVGVLVDEVQWIASQTGLECTVLGREELVAGGFGCLLAVNAGSVEPPALVEVRYTPPVDDGRTPHVALVGKGITFDSGGLSLKPPSGMTTMKSDMSGAAAVLSVLAALPALGVRVPVRGYLALTDNMPGPTATRPGEIVRARNGTTVEILDTDAEGRLVLADAIAYAVESAPVAVIDIATLTGYARTLGRDYTVVHSDTPVLRDALLDAAASVGELAWDAPFARHMRGHLDSGIADLRNIGEPDEGDPVLAAQFLSSFADGVPWCHLDIGEAGWAGSTSGELVKGATGAMVRTLCEHLARL